MSFFHMNKKINTLTFVPNRTINKRLLAKFGSIYSDTNRRGTKSPTKSTLVSVTQKRLVSFCSNNVQILFPTAPERSGQPLNSAINTHYTYPGCFVISVGWQRHVTYNRGVVTVGVRRASPSVVLSFSHVAVTSASGGRRFFFPRRAGERRDLLPAATIAAAAAARRFFLHS